jgi:hypothetical protein
MPKFGHALKSESGVAHTVPILLIVAAVGVISFLLISSTLPLGGWLNNIFPKSASQAASDNGEQFAGPFPSWDQVTCTGGDDTAMLQSHLTVLGTAGHSPVMYIKSGTCRITSSLYLDDTHGGIRYGGVSLLGADPANTKILWAGPAGGTMMYTAGLFNTRIGRLTWDGGGTAHIIYELTYDQDFSTGNRHEDEYFTNLPANGIAVRAGQQGIGDAETEWIRCHFIGPMQMGILQKNFNVLDYWVWDSEFINTKTGIGDYDPNGDNGAGAFAVNRSNFINNNDDMSVANTMFYSSRWNYSRGAQFHIHGYDIGNPGAPWTSQGETIINPVQQVNKLGNSGALGVMDDVIVGGPATGGSQVWQGYMNPAGGDLWDIGNRFTNTNGGQYSAPASPFGIGRYLVYGLDDQLGQSITDPGPISLPPTPARSTLQVIEVQNGDIAGALAQAGNNHVIVHIPYGTYQVNQTLQVGPNVILVGDGNGTNGTILQAGQGVNPIIHVAGPSHAEIRFLTTNSATNNARQGVGILVDNADQAGGLVHVDHWTSGQNHIGIEAQNLQNTIVDFIAGGAGTNTKMYQDTGPAVDFSANAAKLHIFTGAGADSDRQYQLLNGGEIVSENMFYQGGAHEDGIIEHPVMEGSNGTLVLDGGNYAAYGGYDASQNAGMTTIIGMGEGTNCQTDPNGGPKFGPNTLLIDYSYGWGSDTPSCNKPPTFTGGPFVSRLNRHNNGGGGSDNGPEADLGVSDVAQFIRTHLAPERNAKPLPLTSRADNVTDVRITMVNSSNATSGLKVVGAPCTSNCSTPQPTQAPTNVDPVGNFDSASCSGLVGWTCDQNDFSQALRVDFYKDAPFGSGGTLIGSATANVSRQDLITANVCGGTGNHGFSAPLPASIVDGQPHSIYAHAINTPTGNNPVIGGSPKTVTCSSTPAPTPTPTPASGGWIPPTCTGATFSGCSDEPQNVCTDWGDASKPNWSQTLWNQCQQACSSSNHNTFCGVSTPTPTPTAMPLPAAPTITKTGVCAPAGGYTGSGVVISWTNPSGAPVSFTDISADSSFGSFYNKSVTGTSTTAPSGFSLFGASGALTLTANTQYFVRVYNGSHSSSTSFSIPACASSTPTPTPTSNSTCQGADIDHNGTVNIFDYNTLVTNFGKTGVGAAGGDVDGNGTVNIFDYNIIVSNFSKTGC